MKKGIAISKMRVRTSPISHFPFQNDIRTVHEAAVLGDLEKISAQEFRQPIYTSKDINGVPAFHKVRGLHHARKRATDNPIV